MKLGYYTLSKVFLNLIHEETIIPSAPQESIGLATMLFDNRTKVFLISILLTSILIVSVHGDDDTPAPPTDSAATKAGKQSQSPVQASNDNTGGNGTKPDKVSKKKGGPISSMLGHVLGVFNKFK